MYALEPNRRQVDYDDVEYDEFYREKVRGMRLAKRLLLSALLLLTLFISVYNTLKATQKSTTFSVPLYKDATNFRATSGAVYLLFFPITTHNSDTRESVAYTTKASSAEILSFYKRELEAQNYYSNECCSNDWSPTSMGMIPREPRMVRNTLGGSDYLSDLTIRTEPNLDGTQTVHIRVSQFTSVSCHCSDLR